MKTLVVYYSRSGMTRKVASYLGEKLRAIIEEIVDKDKREGALGYIRSGKDAFKKNLAEVEDFKNDPSSFDLVVIGTPVWAGTMAPAVRTYIERNKEKIQKSIFFSTQGGAREQKVFKEMEAVLGKAPDKYFFLTDKEVKNGSFEEKIEKALKGLE